MIKLDKNKPKTIKMDVNVQGIDKTKLNFSFKIELLEFSISFKPELISENKLQIDLPSLSSKIVTINAGRYKACLEINDGEKYFLKPWDGEILIEEESIITANVEESENLDPSTVKVDFVEDENYKPKANIKNIQENKTKKKMTKDEAVEFVQKIEKKFKNEDKKIVNKFIKKVLNENGFNYNPDKFKKKKSNNKQSLDKNNIKSKNDVLNYLRESGIKSENTLERLMETIDNQTGGDVQSMIDMAERMINPNHTQFENTNDVYEFFQNNNQSTMLPNQSNQTNNNYGDGQEVDNIELDNGISVPSSSVSESSYKSNLMEQIKNAKSDLTNQINNN